MKASKWAVILTLFSVILQADRTFAESPGDVVKQIYDLANKGKYTEIENYLSEELLLTYTRNLRVGGGAEVWRKPTQNQTLEKLEILKEEIDGDEATVLFTKFFQDGSTQQGVEDLIKVGGAWKLTLDAAKKLKRAKRLAPAVLPELFSLITEDKFEDAFKVDPRWKGGAAILSLPKFEQEREMAKLKERARLDFYSPYTGNYSMLAAHALLKPQVEFMELNVDRAYYKLTFNSPEDFLPSPKETLI